MEIVQLNNNTFEWCNVFYNFLQSISEDDRKLFYPYSFDIKTVKDIFIKTANDVHYIFIEGEKIIAYGLLRGWDEGYVIPSLGIYIDPLYRGKGLSKKIMLFLHSVALLKNSKSVRLTVYKNNTKAINLYKSVGYNFTEDGDRYLGIINI